MARRRHKTKRPEIPMKPDLEITNVQEIEVEQTIAPGNYDDSLELFDDQGTTDTTSYDQEYEYSAPIHFPNREKLARSLVPSDLVYKLEEYRSDQSHISAVFYSLLGAFLGVIVNWTTAEPILFSRASIIIEMLLLIMLILTGLFSLNYRRRVEKIKKEIDSYNAE